jgi:hypothetical protein
MTSVDQLYSCTNFCISRLLFVSSSLLLLDLEFILFAQS